LLRNGQGWWIVNDLSVANYLNAILVPPLPLIPKVAIAVNILADNGNRLPHYIVDLLGVQARDLEILHSILFCVFFDIHPVNISVGLT
jgi:hypothetical protein